MINFKNHMLRTISLLLILLTFSFPVFSKGFLKNLEGEKIALSSLSGKWVVINVWAPWCQPCLDEIPTLNRFAQKDNIALFGINFDLVSPTEQKLKADELNIRYPMLSKSTLDELNLGDVSTVPVTFIFNPQGKLAYKLYGKLSYNKLSRLVKTG